MICLTNLSFSYDSDGVNVFDNLNLSIVPHTWVVIAGPDGSGKTTLCKLIKGLLIPDSGSITIGSSVDADTASIGYLGGDPGDLMVGITVEEDVAFGMENRGIPSRQIRAGLTDALSRTGLDGMERRLVHTLSGGEQQKVALAGCLAMQAEVLIIDEATTMLDRPTRRSVRSMMATLQADTGMTIIEASNNWEDLLEADRVLFLSSGRFEFDGTPGEFQRSSLGIRWSSMTGGVRSLRSALVEHGFALARETRRGNDVAILLNEINMLRQKTRK